MATLHTMTPILLNTFQTGQSMEKSRNGTVQTTDPLFCEVTQCSDNQCLDNTEQSM